MFKLRKVCAVLCSGMCALGSASADRPNKVNSLMEIAANNHEFFESSVEKFRNEEIAKTERMRKISAYGLESLLLFGSIFGDGANSAMAVGRADILDNRDILKLMSKADIDSLKKMAYKEKIKSILSYIFLRWKLPCFPAAVLSILSVFFVKGATMDSENRPRFKNAQVVNILVLIIVFLAIYNNVAFAFDKLAHRQWGRNKELQDMCKEILEIAERVKRNMQKEKSKKGNNAKPVKKNKKKSKSGKNAQGVNQKKSGVFDKRKLAEQKVANVNLVGKNSNKAGKLGKSVGGVAPVAQ